MTVPTSKKKLTIRQRKFVREYGIDYNGTRAARAAGFNQKRANQIAYLMLHQERFRHVREAIDAETNRSLFEAGVKRDRVLRELAAVALSDIRNLYDKNGALLPPDQWDAQTAASIAAVEVDELFEGRGEDRRQIGTTRKVRRFDKVRALEKLGEHLKLWSDQPNVPPEGPGLTIIVQQGLAIDGSRVVSGQRVSVALEGPE